VPEFCTVLIAAPDLLPTLKQRTLEADSELLAFSDTEALRALDVISRRRPRVVALEKMFAATPRGAALINRIRADPTLSGLEIRVVSHDVDDSRVVSPAAAGDRAVVPTPSGAATPAATSAAVIAPAPLLDQRGTRRAPRYTIAGTVDMVADGNAVTVIDVSTVGAQVVSSTILKPNQKLRVTVADEQITMRINAVVAWASFEIPPKSGPRYRAGIEFIDANAAEVDGFRLRHSQQSA